MTKPLEKRLADLIDNDEQGQLVLRIQALAYKINQASIADVCIDYSPTILHVKVVEYFRVDPTIDKPLSLGSTATIGSTNAMLMARLHQMIKDLQTVLDNGDKRPKGAA